MTEPFASIRKEFPFLLRQIDGHPIIYLDNAATSPKLQCVIDAVTGVYRNYTSNVHRGVHTLADEVTEAYEDARREIASFINASPSEIVFTRNSTEGINLVASGLGLRPDDEVVLTPAEHNSNYLPWNSRAKTVAVGMAEDGLPLYDEVEKFISPHTKLLTLAHVSSGTADPDSLDTICDPSETPRTSLPS